MLLLIFVALYFVPVLPLTFRQSHHAQIASLYRLYVNIKVKSSFRPSTYIKSIFNTCALLLATFLYNLSSSAKFSI